MIVVVSSPTFDQFRVFNKLKGEWSDYQLPKGMRGFPDLSQGSNSQLVLSLSGKSISEVSAYNAQTGKWSTRSVEPPFLPPSIHAGAGPRIIKNAVFYALGNRVFAYSFPAEKWDVVEFEPGAQPGNLISPLNPFGVGYRDSKNLYVFDVNEGRWKRIDWELIEKMSAEDMKKFLQGGMGGAGGMGMM
jgi:hypothetical protein